MGSDSLLPKSYRPVALLQILSKVMEKAVFRQLVTYLEDNKLIHPNLHGQSSLVDLGFKHRAVQVHNKVPASVSTGSSATVKKKLKKWFLQNVPID